MVTEKERKELEYVRLIGYENTISNLGDVSGNINNCINNVSEVTSLEDQKHAEIRKAKTISREIIRIANKLDIYLLKKKFHNILNRKNKSLVYVQNLSTKDAIDLDKENLRNLKRNLENMEDHFKQI